MKEPQSVDAQSEPRELPEIKSNSAQNIKNAFNSPSKPDVFEALFSTSIDDARFSEIVSLLSFRQFHTESRHVEMLNKIPVKNLSADNQWEYHILIYSVQERRGKYDLALKHAEEAARLAETQSDKKHILSSLIAKGVAYARMSHPGTEKLHQHIIKFAKENSLTDGLSWAYHNWGSYLWAQDKVQEAILVYGKETPLREQEGANSLAMHYGFMANRLEVQNPRGSAEYYLKLIELAHSSPGAVSKENLAECYYRIARLQLKHGPKGLFSNLTVLFRIYLRRGRPRE